VLTNIVPLALAAALGFGPAATALNDTGTIASVNTGSDTVTLTDGITFAFDDEDCVDRLSAFKPGDAVAISYDHVGTSLEGGAISPVNATYLGDQLSEYPNHGLDNLD